MKERRRRRTNGEDVIMSEVTPSRVKCPKCGSIDVKQTEDKSKVLSYAGGQPIYKKIWKCKKCGETWG